MRTGAERDAGIERDVYRTAKGGSHQVGTIHKSSSMRIGWNCACVARTQS